MTSPRAAPRVLVLVQSYLPGFQSGGPVRSLAGIVDWLGEELRISIVTRDRDKDGIPYENVQRGAWQMVGNARVYYARPQELGVRGLLRIIRSQEFDTLYLNSFWNSVFTVRPLLLRRAGLIAPGKTILSPRGELSSGALQFKRAKKMLYTSVAKRAGLLRDLVWQASSDEEAEEIRSHIGPGLSIVVARNLVMRNGQLAPSAATHSTRKEPGKLRVAFLSRISPKKNLAFALESMADVNAAIEFDIYGPIDDRAYWNRCESIIQRLPSSVRVRHHGPIPHERARATLAGHDLFYLPTFNENFGHAILDALIAGCPVLISDRTPWRDLAAHGVGWDLPLDDREAFTVCLQRAAKEKTNAWETMRQRARAFGLSRAADPVAVEQHRALFMPNVSQN